MHTFCVHLFFELLMTIPTISMSLSILCTYVKTERTERMYL